MLSRRHLSTLHDTHNIAKHHHQQQQQQLWPLPEVRGHPFINLRTWHLYVLCIPVIILAIASEAKVWLSWADTAVELL